MQKLKLNKIVYSAILCIRTEFGENEIFADIFPDKVSAENWLKDHFTGTIIGFYESKNLTVDELERWAEENRFPYKLSDREVYFTDSDDLDLKGVVFGKNIKFCANVSVDNT